MKKISGIKVTVSIPHTEVELLCTRHPDIINPIIKKEREDSAEYNSELDMAILLSLQHVDINNDKGNGIIKNNNKEDNPIKSAVEDEDNDFFFYDEGFEDDEDEGEGNDESYETNDEEDE